VGYIAINAARACVNRSSTVDIPLQAIITAAIASIRLVQRTRLSPQSSGKPRCGKNTDMAWRSWDR
jgi:hypothetical protein